MLAIKSFQFIFHSIQILSVMLLHLNYAQKIEITWHRSKLDLSENMKTKQSLIQTMILFA